MGLPVALHQLLLHPRFIDAIIRTGEVSAAVAEAARHTDQVASVLGLRECMVAHWRELLGCLLPLHRQAMLAWLVQHVQGTQPARPHLVQTMRQHQSQHAVALQWQAVAAKLARRQLLATLHHHAAVRAGQEAEAAKRAAVHRVALQRAVAWQALVATAAAALAQETLAAQAARLNQQQEERKAKARQVSVARQQRAKQRKKEQARAKADRCRDEDAALAAAIASAEEERMTAAAASAAASAARVAFAASAAAALAANQAQRGVWVALQTKAEVTRRVRDAYDLQLAERMRKEGELYLPVWPCMAADGRQQIFTTRNCSQQPLVHIWENLSAQCSSTPWLACLRIKPPHKQEFQMFVAIHVQEFDMVKKCCVDFAAMHILLQHRVRRQQQQEDWKNVPSPRFYVVDVLPSRTCYVCVNDLRRQLNAALAPQLLKEKLEHDARQFWLSAP